MSGTLARPLMGDAPRKPAPNSGRVARFENRVKRRALKAKADKIEKAAEYQRQKAIRFHCFLRDHRRCRAFGYPLKFETDNLTKLAQSHHIVHKSAGGSDESENRITLSQAAHAMHHEGRLEITGDGNGMAIFRLYEFAGGTRKFVRTWGTHP